MAFKACMSLSYSMTDSEAMYLLTTKILYII